MDEHSRTGFPLKYLDPFYRKLFIDRIMAEEEETRRSKEPSSQYKQAQKLDNLVEKTQAPLLSIRQSIPLNPFPNEIIVDINKINIIIRYFFFSKHIHSVYIKDVSDVMVETGLFFATLRIVDVGFTENSIDINYLKTHEAERARRIIQGLVVAQKNGIDFSLFEDSKLCEKIEHLGEAGNVA